MRHTTSKGFAALLAGHLLFSAPAAAATVDEPPTSTAPRPAAERPAADPTMPAMLRLALIQSRAGQAGSAFHIDRNGRGANPRHDLELAFTPGGGTHRGEGSRCGLSAAHRSVGAADQAHRRRRGRGR